MNRSLLSSSKSEWETPPDLFAALHRLYRFNMDACASDRNALCKRYFTAERSVLAYQMVPSDRVFMNPPYGRPIGGFVEWAFVNAHASGGFVIGLLPARVDTAWWREFCEPMRHRHLPTRIKFRLNGKAADPAPFPSSLVFFGEPFPFR